MFLKIMDFYNKDVVPADPPTPSCGQRPHFYIFLGTLPLATFAAGRSQARSVLLWGMRRWEDILLTNLLDDIVVLLPNSVLVS